MLLTNEQMAGLLRMAQTCIRFGNAWDDDRCWWTCVFALDEASLLLEHDEGFDTLIVIADQIDKMCDAHTRASDRPHLRCMCLELLACMAEDDLL